MAAFVKYENASQILNITAYTAAGNILKVLLSNTAPNVATHQVLLDAVEITAGNGYTAGGVDTANDVSRSGGTTSVTGVDVVITASVGSIGPFRYVILHDSTANKLLGYWDYGSSVTLLAGESLTVDFGTSLFTVA